MPSGRRRRSDALAHRDERVDHRVADVVDRVLRVSLAEQVLARLGRVDEQQLGDGVGHDPVDLLGHRAVEAAQAGLDVADRHVELGRDERGRHRRVHVARHQHDVRLHLDQHRLQPLHQAGGLLRMRAGADLEPVVRLADAELVEEDR
jgi:hypothetical protein